MANSRLRKSGRRGHSECRHSGKFNRAADKFDEERLSNVRKFLRVVKEVIKHLMIDKCHECQRNLIQGYQFPEDCTDPSLGHQVYLYEPMLTDLASAKMDRALSYIEREHRDLRSVVQHVRTCLVCNLIISEARGDF